jgi:hypothetical protein
MKNEIFLVFEPLLFIKLFTPLTSPLAKRLCHDPSLSLRATEGSAAISFF